MTFSWFVPKIDWDMDAGPYWGNSGGSAKEIDTKTVVTPQPERRPWRCPNCKGSGRLYDASDGSCTAILTITCHSCNGTGIVWG